jgi:polyhydroxybutyrate depolymerase
MNYMQYFLMRLVIPKKWLFTKTCASQTKKQSHSSEPFSSLPLISLILTFILVGCGGGGTSDNYIETPPPNGPQTVDNGSCPATNWDAGSMSITHNGIDRQMRVYIPSSYKSDTPSPMILAFHGWGGGENDFLDNETVRNQLDDHNYIMIAPVGLGSSESSPASWSFRGSTTGLDGDGTNPLIEGDSDKICDPDLTPNYTYSSCAGIAENTCSWTQCQDDDMSFVTSLVTQAQENLCVDGDRIFATGGSNGGMFVWDLGNNESTASIFRAVAPIIGLPHRGYADQPIKSDGLPVILVTGMLDTTVPPGNWDDKSFTTTTNGESYYYTGASAIAEKWAEALDCDTSVPPTITSLSITSELECRSWDFCRNADSYPSVLDCRGNQMGHAYNFDESWPLIIDFFNDR